VTITRPRPESASDAADVAVEIGLNAAIVALKEDEPHVLTVRSPATCETRSALPFGLFTPLKHRTLEIGLRDWVREQSNLELGYVEQLYTFGDRGRHASPSDPGLHVVSIGYLALTGAGQAEASSGVQWSAWYRHFPWEDWRQGKPPILTEIIEPRLEEWAAQPERRERKPALGRKERFHIAFGLSLPWDDEKVLERYELLYEAGLVAEAKADGREAAASWSGLPAVGLAMAFDHRRILATAISRLRSKLKYRPVIFELVPETFTLFELQRIVEAILGSFLHKQNFRRLVEAGGLVEPAGGESLHTGGRPARLYRFRPTVLLERPAPGVRVKVQAAIKPSLS
jgi:hypothetical protein